MTSTLPIVQHWSTREVAPAQAFDYYAEALGSAVDPMRVTRNTAGPFTAEIAAAACGPIAAIRIAGTEHGCARGPRELARGGERHFRLIRNAASSWSLEHRGTGSLLRPGEAVLLDSRIGHRTELHGPFDVLHLKFPADWARRWLADPDRLVGVPIRPDSGVRRALTGFIAHLTPAFVVQAPLPMTVLADHLGALLSLAADETGGHARPSLRDLAVFEKIRSCVAQRCAEVSLTASDVAVALQISPRTLHRTLAACGRTFVDVLMSARVELAMGMLTSAASSRVTSAEIGRRAGFCDASHFSRVVKRRTGFTPGQLRPGRR